MSESVFYGYVVIDYSLLRIINHLVSAIPPPPPPPHRIILHSQAHVCVEQCCPLLVELLFLKSLPINLFDLGEVGGGPSRVGIASSANRHVSPVMRISWQGGSTLGGAETAARGLPEPPTCCCSCHGCGCALA